MIPRENTRRRRCRQTSSAADRRAPKRAPQKRATAMRADTATNRATKGHRHASGQLKSPPRADHARASRTTKQTEYTGRFALGRPCLSSVSRCCSRAACVIEFVIEFLSIFHCDSLLLQAASSAATCCKCCDYIHKRIHAATEIHAATGKGLFRRDIHRLLQA